MEVRPNDNQTGGKQVQLEQGLQWSIYSEYI